MSTKAWIPTVDDEVQVILDGHPRDGDVGHIVAVYEIEDKAPICVSFGEAWGYWFSADCLYPTTGERES